MFVMFALMWTIRKISEQHDFCTALVFQMVLSMLPVRGKL